MSQLCILSVLLLFAAKSALAEIKIGAVTVGNTDGDYLSYARFLTVPHADQNGSVWESGNDVSGKSPAEITDIANAIKVLESKPVIREIYDKMQTANNEVFAFHDLDHAQLVVSQRLRIIAQMKSFNLYQNFWYVDGSHSAGMIVPEGTVALWRRGRSKTGSLLRQYGGTALEAIRQLCVPVRGVKAYGDCEGAVYACVWYGTAEVLLSSFNTYYPGASALDMDPLVSRAAYKNRGTPGDPLTLVPGDTLYFKNDNYGELGYPENEKAAVYLGKKGKKLWAGIQYWGGENVIYLGKNSEGEETFEGLGGSDVQGVTAEQMRNKLKQQYNEDLALLITEAAKTNGILTVPIDGASKQFTFKKMEGNDEDIKKRITMESLARIYINFISDSP